MEKRNVTSFAAAKRHLSAKDKVLARIIKTTPLEEPKARTEHFRTLVGSIISQQLSTKAADTIEKRFRALYEGSGFPSPRAVAKTPLGKMRKAGLSRNKCLFIKGLAKKVVSGKLDLKTIGRKADTEVMDTLVALKGIGRWTAEMFLIFSLNHPDVFALDDLGLQNAVARAYKLRKHPPRKTLTRMSEKWKPYRSIASRYLWASLDGGGN